MKELLRPADPCGDMARLCVHLAIMSVVRHSWAVFGGLPLSKRFQFNAMHVPAPVRTKRAPKDLLLKNLLNPMSSLSTRYTATTASRPSKKPANKLSVSVSVHFHLRVGVDSCNDNPSRAWNSVGMAGTNPYRQTPSYRWYSSSL